MNFVHFHSLRVESVVLEHMALKFPLAGQDLELLEELIFEVTVGHDLTDE
jgi:hypothetical protein